MKDYLNEVTSRLAATILNLSRRLTSFDLSREKIVAASWEKKLNTTTKSSL